MSYRLNDEEAAVQKCIASAASWGFTTSERRDAQALRAVGSGCRRARN
jgi:hypothetical protein